MQSYLLLLRALAAALFVRCIPARLRSSTVRRRPPRPFRPSNAFTALRARHRCLGPTGQGGHGGSAMTCPALSPSSPRLTQYTRHHHSFPQREPHGVSCLPSLPLLTHTHSILLYAQGSKPYAGPPAARSIRCSRPWTARQRQSPSMIVSPRLLYHDRYKHPQEPCQLLPLAFNSRHPHTHHGILLRTQVL